MTKYNQNVLKGQVGLLDLRPIFGPLASKGFFESRRVTRIVQYWHKSGLGVIEKGFDVGVTESFGCLLGICGKLGKKSKDIVRRY